ncbi:co-chaperone YbbN [Devriesea agamarum]|uniref:co-chaperone YbbN n=1 Tax=Devriesea agamarum TaxID=472569 RepID=UPI00071E0AD9|nr:tetratricopeptide repeat protein [Devriesea agamarum]
MTDPYGLIDLASLKNPANAEGASSLASSSSYEVEINETTLPKVVEETKRRALLVVVTSSRVPGNDDFLATMRDLVAAKNGAITLGVVDADKDPRVAAALRPQQLPTTMLITAGQVQPLFQGAHGRDQLAPVIDEVVRLAAEQGLDTSGVPQDAEPELPPLHQAAVDAIERSDIPAAIAAYEEALAENPADSEAKAGLASVRLMQRTEELDAASARQAAAENPLDLDAQLTVADLDLLGGHVEDAFARLLDLTRDAVRAGDTDRRDEVKTRLLDYFEITGAQDPRVAAARRKLGSLLF